MERKTASIIVMTHNRKQVLEKTVKAMLKLDYPEPYEIVVINDGSSDGTKEMLEKQFGRNPKVVVINQARSMPCAARNNGIRKAKHNFIVIMDDDCIPDKKWLKNLMSGFDDEGIGVVSSYAPYGGTSTVFRKKVLDKVGLYDEDYRYYREDTDLVFRVLDAGYMNRMVKADFVHEHKIEAPKGLLAFARHGWERVRYHKNDVLLFKKHPKRTKEFLDIRLGFIRNPMEDFRVATGTWQPGGKFSLSSPRGITYMQAKTPLHKLVIVLGGIVYVVMVKLVRLFWSIRFLKLLI